MNPNTVFILSTIVFFIVCFGRVFLIAKHKGKHFEMLRNTSNKKLWLKNHNDEIQDWQIFDLTKWRFKDFYKNWN